MKDEATGELTTTTSSTAASSVTSAAGSAAAAGKGTIGILMPTLNAEFFAVTANSMAARLAEEGYTGNIQGFDNDAAQAVSVIENFITDGVQGKSLKGDPKATFERYSHLFRPQEAIAVFTDIRAKALAFEGVAA